MADDDLQKMPSEITFHYIKSNHYRVIHGDGVYGGPTNRGTIVMNFFSERNPIARTVTHKIRPDQTIGDELSRESRGGIIREVEAGIVLSKENARSIANWLLEKVRVLDEHDQMRSQHEAKGQDNA